MAYDAKLVLHGLNSGGTHNDLAAACDDAVLLSVNDTGSKCLDVRKTGAKGLIASLILTEVADADSFSDEAIVVIQDSDHLDRGWAEVTRFPLLRSHIIRIWVTTTTAFVPGDLNAALTAEGTSTGILVAYDDAVGVDGGTGYIYVEKDLVDDVFTDAVGQTMHGTTGRSTVTIAALGEDPVIQMQPGTYNRRFQTNKRYIRAYIAGVTHTLGICWILLTNEAGDAHSPEYPV